MVQMYYDQDANLDLLKGKTVAVIGYGSQGHAHSQNLRDSGVSVVVAEVPGPNYDQAKADGFDVLTAAEAAKKGDIIVMTVPDQLQAIIYKNELAAEMSEGKTLLFAHGFNIHFGQIVPPANVDVIMVAPRVPATWFAEPTNRAAAFPC